MDAPNRATLLRLEQAAARLASIPEMAGQVYANGLNRAAPIVSKHFTAGNQQRYGWAALSRDYFLAKKGGATRVRGSGYLFLTPKQRLALVPLKGKARSQAINAMVGGRKAAALDTRAGFRSSTGTMSGEGKGTNLPMLVLTGKLKAAVVSSRRHVVSRNGDMAVIRFTNLPEYAIHLHKGTAKMPQRSPVEPGQADQFEIVAELEKWLSAQTRRGGTVPVFSDHVPGRARVIG